MTDPEHSVWDEPALSNQLAGEPSPEALTHAGWVAEQWAQHEGRGSWRLTVGLALIAGPFAIAGALMGGSPSWFGLFLVVVLGPITEELLKVAGPLFFMEKKPWRFASRLQIVLCAMAGGLVFAVIENIIYLEVYVDAPTPELVAWRWSVCTALHVCCSAIAGIGVASAWRRAAEMKGLAKLQDAMPLLLTAMVVHGLYNLAAVVLSSLEDAF